MSEYAVGAFFLAILLSVIYIPFRMIYLERILKETQRYPLFAVRDEFVRLKIKGEFDRDLELYNFCVDLCNALIRNSKNVHLGALLQAMAPMTAEDEARYRDFLSKMDAAPAEVRNAIVRLLEATGGLLINNSTLVRCVDKFRRLMVRLCPWGRACDTSRRQRDAQVTKFGNRALDCVEAISNSRGQALKGYLRVESLIDCHKEAMPAA